MTVPDRGRRYDRQIRIWGPHGQELLEKANICVVGAGPAATETLKSLVLGGIAAFTLVDSRDVTERDLGNNFFLDAASLGKNRAEVAVALLREMNEAVRGSYLDMGVDALVASEPSVLEGFDLVIACEVRAARF